MEDMKKIHLSPEQRQLCIEFCDAHNDRPTAKIYKQFQLRMKQLDTAAKPKLDTIPNITRGFNNWEVKLLNNFNALTDLPPGWAVVSCYDSGGNHKLELAGLVVLRHLWNSHWFYGTICWLD